MSNFGFCYISTVIACINISIIVSMCDHNKLCNKQQVVATPLWPSVGVKPNTPKVEDLESSGTPVCLELDSKAQNTSHWGVLGVIGKVLKRRY